MIFYIYVMHEICKEGDFVIFFWYCDVKCIIFFIIIFYECVIIIAIIIHKIKLDH